MISIAITDPITIKVRAVLPCGTVRLRDAGHLAHCSCNSSVPSTGGTSGRQNDTYYNSGYQDQYHQGWQNGRGRGRGYFGGRGSQNPGYQQQQGYSSNRGGRGRGRGRSQPGQSQPAPEPLPDDVEFLAELKGHTGKVTVVAMDQGSGQLFTGSHDGTVRCVSTVDVGGEVDSLLLEAGFLFVGIKTPANQGQIKAWNMSTNQETVLEGHTGQVLSLAAAGGMLFSGAQDATIRVWKPSPLAGFECSAVLRADGGGHSSPVSCLCASGPYLFSADFKGNIKAREWHVGVWDVTAGVLRQAVDRAHSGAALAAITDLFVWQNCLFSGSLDGCIKLPSFEGRGVLSGVKNVRAMTGYSAGNLLLSGDERGQVKIWRWRELPQANAGAF
ncbi:Zinc finger CCCH domain-containing protein 59 [Auxenochlorella protothecoides]|uniref:Zinc finger CCCH domain-containing protein 59 n=1 Tax=Auxenochlorella protothecoides TaxID=3075 RepID=A0A087SDE3_AUXPR|nr:Zinc finger CCCH domain-containing protein 59 [Auxenochlorella protothecoides]KFM23747.1 Zinc finger CCCH domain-containing protein 59 [Auxenochlorella protothecoides]